MKRYDYDFTDAYFRMIESNLKNGKYRFIGKGSGRIVYDLGNGQVVKIAKNMRGIAQNIEEYKISLVDDSNLFARVYDLSDDYSFLIMDRAKQIEDISLIWDYFHVGSNEELVQVRRLRDISNKYNLMIWDLSRAVNWGEINGRPKIIDYGFTRQVRIRYYKNPTIGLLRN